MALNHQQIYSVILPHSDTTIQASAAADKVLALIEAQPPPEPERTTAPAELVEFLQRMKGMRMRQGKGEFVASDGTRMPYDFVFEREEKPRGGTADAD